MEGSELRHISLHVPAACRSVDGGAPAELLRLLPCAAE